VKASEIRKMTAEQMKGKLIELKKQLFTLRFQHQSDQLSNTAGLSAVRKDIAKIYTISKEMNINIS
jgi:large subunit ribosomal protein L29